MSTPPFTVKIRVMEASFTTALPDDHATISGKWEIRCDLQHYLALSFLRWDALDARQRIPASA
jgi:hypothetical protein